MNTPQRYNKISNGEMIPESKGSWVKWEDVEPLLDTAERLKTWKKDHERILDASNLLFRSARDTVKHLLPDPETGIEGICRAFLEQGEEAARYRTAVRGLMLLADMMIGAMQDSAGKTNMMDGMKHLRLVVDEPVSQSPVPDELDILRKAIACQPCTHSADPHNPFKCVYSTHWAASQWRTDRCPLHRLIPLPPDPMPNTNQVVEKPAT
jgi:hypothetical protein